MRPVIHLNRDGSGGGGTGTGWNGQVEFRSNLPITLGTPAVGEIYLVEKKTTLLGFTTYQSGLYRRDNNTGALSDWRRLNVKIQFTDSEFTIVSAADTSKRAKFDVSLVTASTTRTYIYPDKNGTIALLSDVTLQGLPSVLGQDNTTGLNDISIDDGQVIKSTTGNASLEFRRFGFDYITLRTSLGGVVVTDFGVNISTDIDLTQTQKSDWFLGSDSVYITLDDTLANKQGSFFIQNNEASDVSSVFNKEQFPAQISSKNYLFKQGVINSFAGGGEDIIIKTDNGNYSNQFIFNTGLAGELIVNHTPSTTDYTQTHQDDNGVIALTKDIPKAFFAVNLDSAESSISRVFAGGRTTFTVTHNLNTLDLKPEVFRVSNGRTMGWRTERTGVNIVEVSRTGNVADGDFRILI